MERLTAVIDQGDHVRSVDMITMSPLDPGYKETMDQAKMSALKIGVYQRDGETQTFYPAFRVLRLEQTTLPDA